MHQEHYNRYKFAENFVSDKNILDIACGEGEGACLLSKSAKSVVGVDIRNDAINFAKKHCHYGNADFKVGDATNLLIEDNFFDGVVSFETIEHLNKNDQYRFLSGLKRVVKPNGFLIISTPDKRSWRKMGLSWDDHLHELDYKEFNDMLEQYFLVKEYFGQGMIIRTSLLKRAIRHSLNFLKQIDFLNLRYHIFSQEKRKKVDSLTSVVSVNAEVYKLDPQKDIPVTIIAICINIK